MARKFLDKWQGYTVQDCDCKYCLYYGGKQRGEIQCLAAECVCKEELKAALERGKTWK